MRKDESGSRNKTQTNVKSFAVTQRKSKEAERESQVLPGPRYRAGWGCPGLGPVPKGCGLGVMSRELSHISGGVENWQLIATTRRHNVVFVVQFLLAELLLHV